MSFAHLHVHTEYSLLDGSNKIKEYVKQVAALGMTAAAITDHGNMYGVIDFYKAAHDAGIHPVLGCEVYVAPHSRFDKELTGGEERYNHLILLAQNDQGYHNLCKIVSKGFTEGFYYRPRVDREVLAEYHEGIICLSACVAGEVPRLIQKGMLAEAREAALWYRDTFGEDNYYLELQDHGLPVQRQVNMELLRISKETGIPLAATNDVHYTYATDVDSHDVLLCIQTGKHVSDTDRLRYEGGQFYLKSEEEMRALFPYAQEAIENTQRIADRCEVTISFGDYKLPRYDVPAGYDAYGYLTYLCEEGLRVRYPGEAGAGSASGEKAAEAGTAGASVGEIAEAGAAEREAGDADAGSAAEGEAGNMDTGAGAGSATEGEAGGAAAGSATWQQLEARLHHELEVIRGMGFVDYFLIVWDFVNYAKTNGIAVGPGRGSAAGSLVSYCLWITNIDPIRYQLIFERFLNPERVSMPDIDIDFEPERRQEVVDYVSRKYGADRVVKIIAFGTLKARGVIRDVGRALDIPFAKCDQLAKMIPGALDTTIAEALELSPDLKALYDNDEETHNLLDMSMRLEGLPRQIGMHAAGVVICPEAADEYVPLSRSAEGYITTQFEKNTVEKLGLLKMDFLGLRNLTVIEDALDNIERTRGTRPDLQALDYDDKKVYAYIGQGKGEGIFQLESSGMESFMKRLKPDSLEDVIAGISLYRPGPMDSIPRYIDAKSHPEHVTYACPELEPILKATYGCIVYQEQVMQIVRDLAGYTMGRSDTVRSAMSKKKQELMEYERGIFIDGNDAEIEEARKKGVPEEQLPPSVPGCVRNGIPRDVAEGIYDSMIEFAKYAFNKSHAACYAVVAYQTAYLKYYYPAEFMAALMTSETENIRKVGIYIVAARQMGLSILPPDVNQGDVGFTVGEDGIYYALAAIHGVGVAPVAALVEERKRHGAYKSLQDFIERTTECGINKKMVEAMIKAGAFDRLGATKQQMLMVYMKIIDVAQARRKSMLSGQMSLFDIAEGEEKEGFIVQYPSSVGEYRREICLDFEKEVLGIYLSGHPLEGDIGLWGQVITKQAADLYLISSGEDETDALSDEMVNAQDNERCSVGGILVAVRAKATKKGDMMAFATIEDMTGQVELIVFPKTYQQYRSLLEEDARVIVVGRVTAEEGKDGKVIAERVVPFSGVPRTLWLQYADAAAWAADREEVSRQLAACVGRDTVRVYLQDTKQVETLPAKQSVQADEELLGALRARMGEGNVRLTYRMP